MHPSHNMDLNNNLSILSVAEALQILRDRNGITNQAIKDICIKCNLPDNQVTKGRLTRSFTKYLKQRTEASRRSNLNN